MQWYFDWTLSSVWLVGSPERVLGPSKYPSSFHPGIVLHPFLCNPFCLFYWSVQLQLNTLWFHPYYQRKMLFIFWFNVISGSFVMQEILFENTFLKRPLYPHKNVYNQTKPLKSNPVWHFLRTIQICTVKAVSQHCPGCFIPLFDRFIDHSLSVV